MAAFRLSVRLEPVIRFSVYPFFIAFLKRFLYVRGCRECSRIRRKRTVPRAARIAGTSEPRAAETRRAGEGGGGPRKEEERGKAQRRASEPGGECPGNRRGGQTWAGPQRPATRKRLGPGPSLPRRRGKSPRFTVARFPWRTLFFSL